MVSSSASRSAAKLGRSRLPLRKVEVKSVPHADAPSIQPQNPERKGKASLDPTPALVVPLPRRPLFPGYITSAFLKNQPTLATNLAVTCDKTVAAFMLKDASDYRGCILQRRDLQGQDLLERLYPVGTLAEIRGKPFGPEEKLRQCLLGRHRVKMTGTVVTDHPLTVMVEPVDVEDDGEPIQVGHLVKDGLSGEDIIDHATKSVVGMFLETLQIIQSLMGQRFSDPYEAGSLEWYANMWGGHITNLADFGHAVMPVFDRDQHQKALEEENKLKRLELTLEILKRELELDNLTKRFEHYQDGFSDVEKEFLAKFMYSKDRLFLLEKFSEVVSPGEMLIAPSVQMRARICTFHYSSVGIESLEELKDRLKHHRITDHMVGY